MDVLAHSLWAIAVLPGEQYLGKVLFGIIPDLAVFGPNLLIIALRKEKLNRSRDREEMMKWFAKKENRWVKELYRWTHSLIVWAAIIIAAFFYCQRSGSPPPWFLLGAPLHILLDIPTHTRRSFPVQFLTPFSTFQVDGIHWSNKKVLILNYVIIFLILIIRFFFS
jgi:hypothetical protein